MTIDGHELDASHTEQSTPDHPSGHVSPVFVPLSSAPTPPRARVSSPPPRPKPRPILLLECASAIQCAQFSGCELFMLYNVVPNLHGGSWSRTALKHCFFMSSSFERTTESSSSSSKSSKSRAIAFPIIPSVLSPREYSPAFLLRKMSSLSLSLFSSFFFSFFYMFRVLNPMYAFFFLGLAGLLSRV